jgi:hypothetical protein
MNVQTCVKIDITTCLRVLVEGVVRERLTDVLHHLNDMKIVRRKLFVVPEKGRGTTHHFICLYVVDEIE